jgi:hypothetical protein
VGPLATLVEARQTALNLRANSKIIGTEAGVLGQLGHESAAFFGRRFRIGLTANRSIFSIGIACPVAAVLAEPLLRMAALRNL